MSVRDVQEQTQTADVRTLKARYVFPVTGRPIAGGVVTIAAGRIAAVGSRSAGGPVEDMGNVAILPGLVNAHTHLEFSFLPEPLGPPGIGFVDWLRRVVEARTASGGKSELGGMPSRSVGMSAVAQGLQESLQHGTTTLGEIAQPGWPAEQLASSPLDVVVFLELIAPTADRVRPAVQLAREHLELARRPAAWHPGLSPHAPYSVRPELLADLVALSADSRVPVAFHLAEDQEELELLRSGGGAFRPLLEAIGAYDPQAIPPGTRPLDYLHRLAAADRALVIHGNYLDDEEIAYLAENRRRMAVVYCPRSHAHFPHDRYPLEKMLSAGATVALGTDSRASAADLSVLAEMRHVAKAYPAVEREVILRLGTIQAARALGRDHEVGSLEPGKWANLAVVPLRDREAADPHDLLFDSTLPVTQTWCRGTVVAT